MNFKDNTKLDLNSNTIEEIMNSDSFKKARMEMLNGKRPKACMSCFDKEDKGARSRRLEEVKEGYFTLKDAKETTEPNGEIQVNLRKVELRLGNKCNLKCSTCNPVSSSSWKEEYSEITKNPEIELPVNYDGIDEKMFNWAESNSFWENLSKHYSHLSEVNINGGEPMLYSQQTLFLKYLIDKGLSKNITLIYYINLSFISEEITKLWVHFKKTIIHCSIDDIEERNTFIRYPIKWDILEKNFKKLLDMDVEIKILQTLSVYNFFTFEKVATKFLPLSKQINYGINLVTEPFFLSPLSIPPQERKKKLKEVFSDLPFEEYRKLTKLLYNDQFEEKNLKIFNTYNNILLKNRKNNFTKDFSRLYQLLKNY